VASGQATATQKLIVAAHCRKDPTIQAQLTALEASWQQMVAEDEKAENRSWHIPPIKLPIFIAVPLLSGALARSSTRSIQAQSIGPQNYRVEELQADVTLRVARVEGEVWQIMGSVTQHDSLVAEAKVTLHSEESHPRPRITDEDGFFVFSRLWEGSCTLRIRLPDGIVEIPDIQLMDEDDLLL